MGKKRTALDAGEATAELAVFSRETLLGALAKDLKISDLSLFNAGVLVAGFFCWLLCWGVSSLGFASLRDAVLGGIALVSRAGLGWVSAFTAGVEALGVRLALVAAAVDCAGKGLGPVLRYRLATSGVLIRILASGSYLDSSILDSTILAPCLQWIFCRMFRDYCAVTLGQELDILKE